MSVFNTESRETFARKYPEVPHKLSHTLRTHPLLEFERLAEFAESLPPGSVEYNLADLPIAVEGKPEGNGLTVGETIRNIGTCGSWVVIRKIEQDPEYAALLNALLDEVQQVVEPKTGKMLNREGFIFVTSPGGVTPCHFDPEHNILLQIKGSKVMTQFPPNDSQYVADEDHERYHTGGPRELPWRESLTHGGTRIEIGPGEGLFVPVMAPHFVETGPEPSISLSITWRSEWSYAEADARAFNAMIRRIGFSPRAPGRWPASNKAKSLGWRAMRKIGLG